MKIYILRDPKAVEPQSAWRARALEPNPSGIRRSERGLEWGWKTKRKDSPAEKAEAK